MKKCKLICESVFLILITSFTTSVNAGDFFSEILKDELKREMGILSNQDPPVYHMNYRVDYIQKVTIRADFGHLSDEENDKYAVLTTDIRLGDIAFDNTHISKGEPDQIRQNSMIIPYDTNTLAVKQHIWRLTDDVYRKQRAIYLSKKNKISVEETEKYNDFTPGEGVQYFESPLEFPIEQKDLDNMIELMKEVSASFPENTDMMNAVALFKFELVRKYFVSSEGHEIVQNYIQSNIIINGVIRGPEGGPLVLTKVYHAKNPGDLPGKSVLIKDAGDLYNRLLALKEAPLAEPYSGPAILSEKASGVFFHEILGHRVEGHRLKDETDSHTFKLKINEQVLPKSMNVVFNPLLKELNGVPLNGYYQYDDEGSPAEKVTVIQNGILKDFLMGNTPVPGYKSSNGHGRAQPGLSAVSRQSNLLVSTTKPYSEEDLRKMLIKECKKQRIPYGYYFKDVRGGFTNIKRFSPNAFNVYPTEVYRIYVDGREDELVRGVKLIGTPLAMFSNIKAAGDEIDIFNGTCGAESGGVPVSAISPAIYVSKIETQKESQFYSTGPVIGSPNEDDQKK